MSKLEDFLLAEYDHIADAHFESGKQASTYFNYYLIILAAPVVILTLTQGKDLSKVISPKVADEQLIHSIAFFLLFIIAFIGFCVSSIVMNLQLDSVLYARTVNGIRDFFYEKAIRNNEIAATDEHYIRVLPRMVDKPGFHSQRIIVVAFAFINSIFLSASGYIFLKGEVNWYYIFLPVCTFLFHFFWYSHLAKRKQKHYPVPSYPKP